MDGLGSWLLELTSPIARRVIISLGLGVVSYLGLDSAVDGLLAQARQGWGTVSADVATYVAMCGANVGLALISGALIARTGLMALKRLVFL